MSSLLQLIKYKIVNEPYAHLHILVDHHLEFEKHNYP